MIGKSVKTVVIILAGGTGERFNIQVPKQFTKLSGKMIIEHTINAFEKHPLVDEIYLIAHEKYFEALCTMYRGKSLSKVKKILIGGKTRQESSRIGIFACDANVKKVLIHDAVRPFISEVIITHVIQALDQYPAIDVAIPTADTIIQISDDNIINNVPQRDQLMRGQTPQGFQLPIIKEAHKLAEEEFYVNATDDCALILRYKLGDIFVVGGSEYNIKITYPLDLDIADKIFQINSVRVPDIDILILKERLKGKVVVIFGGTSGIGLELVKLCNELGCITYGFSRRNGVDVRNYDTIQDNLKMIYKINNKIDDVICAAGILNRGLLEELNTSNIIDQITINLIGNILVAKASLPYLKQTHGSLLFFASSSYTRGRKEYIPYSASKAGLVNFVQGLADEMNDYAIRINVLNPERTKTPLRENNFGEANETTLLSPRYVALAALKVIVSDLTGSVVDVRQLHEYMNGKGG